MEVPYKPANAIRGWGADLSDNARPGVPMEHAPRKAGNAHWAEPEPQPATPGTFKIAGLDKMPPVFGTAEPPKGLSGLMRAAAYGIPDHRVRHWLLLLLADRVDVAEHNIARAAKWVPLALPILATAAFFARKATQQRRRPRFRFALPF